MASTYSTNLAIELIGTGEQSGTWGTTTNTNLGTLIEQSISGYVTQAITDGSGANTTITIPNGATGVARNMFIEMTGALTFSTTSLIVPANKKMYFIFNNTTGGFAVTVKVSGQTGILVPNGKKVVLTSNGTDIVEAHTAIVGNATMGGTLGITGTTTAAAINASGLVAMAGAATVGTTLAVSGTATMAAINASGLVAMAGAATVGTTLGVTGTATMAAINASGTVAMAGAATVGTTLGVTGTSTMAAINGTAISASGALTAATITSNGRYTQTLTPAAAEYALRSTGQTTGWIAIEMANTGGSYIFAGENSAGNNLITGDSAYDLVIRAPSGISFSANAGATQQMRIASTGAVTIPATLDVTGVSTLTGGATIGTGSNVLGFKVGWLTATNTKSSSTVLTTLSDLTIAIGAGETWLIEWTLVATANLEQTGISLQVDTPASAVQDIFYEYIPQRYDLVGGLYTTPEGCVFQTASGTLVSWTAADIVYGGKAAINIFVRVTASGAGNVTLGYAQETSTGSNLNILRGSRVKAQRTA